MYVVASVCWSIFNKLCRKVLFIHTLVHNTYTSSSCSYTHTHTHSSKLAHMHSYILKRKNKKQKQSISLSSLKRFKMHLHSCVHLQCPHAVYTYVCVRAYVLISSHSCRLALSALVSGSGCNFGLACFFTFSTALAS